MGIYLVRHGKDEDGFRGGWSQRGLTKEGIEQSKKLGEYLKKNYKELSINRVISSDLKRATETAACIANLLQLPIEKSEDWRETNNGYLAGMLNDEADQKYPGLYFDSLRMDESYPGGESPEDNFNRIQKVLDEVLKNQTNIKHNENLLIVTHGGVINIIYHILKGIEWTNKNKPFPTSHTSLHKIEFVKDEWEITQENLVQHLI
ncbi:histidine phosphatase family protein [Marinilactibacillus sp. Marseille-P9653]|uniref:histidine phosphatase family protein n=1 Tax=Marinilactibacillus sp. Marseille-P9653 TaxID=2866583 RepID=UPI001CE3FD5B|nr:histidine phosphatase family protein [Marinilactibacillus sp. Marseille-P9653]